MVLAKSQLLVAPIDATVEVILAMMTRPDSNNEAIDVNDVDV